MDGVDGAEDAAGVETLLELDAAVDPLYPLNDGLYALTLGECGPEYCITPGLPQLAAQAPLAEGAGVDGVGCGILLYETPPFEGVLVGPVLDVEVVVVGYEYGLEEYEEAGAVYPPPP